MAATVQSSSGVWRPQFLTPPHPKCPNSHGKAPRAGRHGLLQRPGAASRQPGTSSSALSRGFAGDLEGVIGFLRGSVSSFLIGHVPWQEGREGPRGKRSDGDGARRKARARARSRRADDDAERAPASAGTLAPGAVLRLSETFSQSLKERDLVPHFLCIFPTPRLSGSHGHLVASVLD